jgi:hypothetical protein
MIINKQLKIKISIYLLAIIITASLFTNCGASSGINFSTRNLDKMKIGVTNQKLVESEFQTPYTQQKISFNNFESNIYYYFFSQKPLLSLKRIDKKELYFEFVDEVLNGILFNNSFESSNDFKMGKKDELVVDKTTKQDIISVLGKYNGEFLLPSNFLNLISKDEYANNIPENAKQVIIYYYSYLKKITFSLNEFINHKKLMLLFLDENEKLVKILFDEFDTQ